MGRKGGSNQFGSVLLGLLVAVCVVDGDVELGGGLLARARLQDVGDFRLGATHLLLETLLAHDQLQQDLVQLHFLLVW